MHLNVRSLCSNIDQLRLELINAPVNIVTLSETWLKSSLDSSFLKIDGYSLHRLDRKALLTNGKVKSGGGPCSLLR